MINKQPFPSLTADIQVRLQHVEKYMYQKRYSVSTIKTYLSFLRHFFAFHAPLKWDDITTNDVVNYNYHVFIKTGKAFSTQNQAINAIKLFYRVHEHSTLVPEQLVRPRKERKLPAVLTLDEVGKIINCTRNLKHRALLMLIYGAGLRVGEALTLELGDIRRAEGLLYIRAAKGKKDRRVPLSSAMLDIFERYYRAYRPSRFLFVGQKGGMYTASSARKVLQRAARDARIQRKVTLHTLRHSYATHLLERGVGLRYIQDILGHNSPKTTMIYTHVSGKRLSEIRSPLDDMDL